MPEQPPSREELVALCERAIVPESKWGNRDSAAAHRQLGEALALLRAGCDFMVRPSSNYHADKIWQVSVFYRGFDFFEYGDDRYLKQDSFYVPTAERLDQVAGDDWYC